MTDPTTSSIEDTLTTNIAYYDHLVAIDLPAWQYARGDWFTIHLFALMQKADVNNYSRLASVYPIEARAFRFWQSGEWEKTQEQGETT